MPTKQVTPTSIKIPVALRERVQILADTRDRSVHSLMLQALETFVEREEQREKLRQDAMKAHEEYMLTGLHTTNTEVKNWLSELSKGKNTEPPQCHL